MQKRAQTSCVFSGVSLRKFVARGKYTGAMIPHKATPVPRFQKISHILLLAP
jgi:hypothetical protein